MGRMIFSPPAARLTPMWLERPSARPDPPRAMRIGILGCGHVSEQYFGGIALHEHLEVVACADRDRARAGEKATEHGVPTVRAPDELLADSAVEVIVNLTPPQAHAAVSLAAIEAGKHVWSEKPLATTLDDARRLLDAADSAGVRLGCAPDTFLGAGLQTAIKLVDDGWLGETIAGGVAMVTEPGYESWHPDVASFYTKGAGPLLDLGPYYVTALVAALGPVRRVTSMARTTFPERTVAVGPRRGEPIVVEVPTHVTGALEFEAGPVVTLLVSWDVLATNLPYIEIYGSAGSLSIANPDEFDGVPRLRRAGAEDFAQPPPPPGSVHWSPTPLIRETGGRRGLGVAEMAHAIERGRPHRANGELAYHVLEVLLALGAADGAPGGVPIASSCARPAPL
jgi:predicted dehydrogenase